MAACSGVQVACGVGEGATGWAGLAAGIWQWPIAACSGVQVAAGAGVGVAAGVGAATGRKVQCPIAACSGVQVAAGAGVGAGAGMTQCPIAACSGVHVSTGAGEGAAVGAGAAWPWPLCCASAGLAAVPASRTRIIRFMLRLRRAGGR